MSAIVKGIDEIRDAMVWPRAGVTLLGSESVHMPFQCQIRYDERNVPMIVLGFAAANEKLCTRLAVYELVMYTDENGRMSPWVHTCVECAYVCRAADFQKSLELRKGIEQAGSVATMRSWRPASLFPVAS